MSLARGHVYVGSAVICDGLLYEETRSSCLYSSQSRYGLLGVDINVESL